MVRSPSNDSRTPSSDSADSVRPRRPSTVKDTQTTARPAPPAPLHLNEDADSASDDREAVKLFRQLLNVNLADFARAEDGNGDAVMLVRREGKNFPIVRGEAEVLGVGPEELLGTLMSVSARREWDPRFGKSEVMSMENEAEHSVLVETWKGLFPSLPSHHFNLTRHVSRSSNTITLLSRSTPSSLPPPRGSTKATASLIAWHLSPTARGTSLVYLSSIDLPSPLSPPIYKILVSEMSAGPRGVGEWVSSEGFAPYWRWGEGEARLRGEEGKWVWRVDGEGKKGGKQRCWLSWDRRMFPRGVEIGFEPTGVAQVARVEGWERTVEVVWEEGLGAIGGARVVLLAGNGDIDDVAVDGVALRREGGPRNGGASIIRPEWRASEAGALRRAPSQTSRPLGPISIPPSIPALNSAPHPTTSTPLANAPTVQLQRGRGIPEDACLVLSKSLYLTRKQMVLLFVMVVAAYTYGRSKRV